MQRLLILCQSLIDISKYLVSRPMYFCLNYMFKQPDTLAQKFTRSDLGTVAGLCCFHELTQHGQYTFPVGQDIQTGFHFGRVTAI